MTSTPDTTPTEKEVSTLEKEKDEGRRPEAAQVASAVAVIESAITQFKPAWVFALFSGGHDSLTSSYVASLASKFDGCVHGSCAINTCIGIPATRQFVIDTCAERAWKLLEYKAADNTKSDGMPDPVIYDEYVLAHGFPGPFMHRKMYNRLKERQLRRLYRDHNLERILLISGCRSQESVRRMGNTEAFQDSGQQAWCAPIHDWSKSDCSYALTAANFKRNETALRFGRSGECLCGAFAKPGELAALDLLFACPASAARIRALEKKVREAGFPWGWEDPGTARLVEAEEPRTDVYVWLRRGRDIGRRTFMH